MSVMKQITKVGTGATDMDTMCIASISIILTHEKYYTYNTLVSFSMNEKCLKKLRLLFTVHQNANVLADNVSPVVKISNTKSHSDILHTSPSRRSLS